MTATRLSLSSPESRAEVCREAIADADCYLNNVDLPQFGELIAAAKLAIRAIDSRISAETCPVREEDREAYEALCSVLAKIPDEII